VNARTILNPALRVAVAKVSLNEISELRLKLEMDVFELRTFLKFVEANKRRARPTKFSRMMSHQRN